MVIYMAISQDKYELPLAVADTVVELAKMLGVSKNTIYSTMSKYKAGERKKPKYIKVKID